MFRIIAIAALLTFGSPAFGNEMNDTKLRSAAGANDITAIHSLLAAGAAINARDARGQTALLIATHANNVAAAAALIEAGADVNAKDAIDDSPYLYAGARGHLDILKLTLAHGADLRSTNRYGGTALIPAAERGHVETVRTLIAAGVDVDHVNSLHWTALLEAIILGDGGPRHVEIVRLLVDAGADVSIRRARSVTPCRCPLPGLSPRVEAVRSSCASLMTYLRQAIELAADVTRRPSLKGSASLGPMCRPTTRAAFGVNCNSAHRRDADDPRPPSRDLAVRSAASRPMRHSPCGSRVEAAFIRSPTPSPSYADAGFGDAAQPIAGPARSLRGAC